MNPPATIRINGRTVAVRPRTIEQLPDAFGEWHASDMRIEYRQEQLPVEERDTILHEVFHALRYLQGRADGGKVEEDYVRSLATGLIGVIDDNPEFAQWLIARAERTSNGSD